MKVNLDHLKDCYSQEQLEKFNNVPSQSDRNTPSMLEFNGTKYYRQSAADLVYNSFDMIAEVLGPVAIASLVTASISLALGSLCSKMPRDIYRCGYTNSGNYLTRICYSPEVFVSAFAKPIFFSGLFIAAAYGITRFFHSNQNSSTI